MKISKTFEFYTKEQDAKLIKQMERQFDACRNGVGLTSMTLVIITYNILNYCNSRYLNLKPMKFLEPSYSHCQQVINDSKMSNVSSGKAAVYIILIELNSMN